MIRTFWTLLLLILALALSAAPAWAGEWTVRWQGERVSFTQDPVIIQDRLYVPLRELAEKTGATVGWEPVTHEVSMERGTQKVSCRIDHSVASLNGNPLYLGVIPTIVGEKTYVPLRFFADSLGLDLETKNKVVDLWESKAPKYLFKTFPPLEVPLSFQLGESRWTLSPKEIDLTYQSVDLLQPGNLIPKIPQKKTDLITYSPEKLRNRLSDISANLRESSGGIQEANVDEALAKAAQRWPQGDFTPIPLPTKELQTEIGAYTTRFNPTVYNRVENLRLALETLNGYTIQPGKTFSFNQAVGPRTAQRGYKEAKIIVGNRYESGLGGGVCQVSSTLYNATDAAGMTMIEVHKHTLPVDYVPKGRDATVSWGTADFRFKNPLNVPVRLETSIDKKGGSMTVKVWKILP